ncbi:hypothetical protein GCM10023320_55660 [Pseudonocardia adelaidensis]|uniref:Uncharacterized protein n=1 Tax=Pseudonocardia adelaidensis TaxID=648754 RepID=A0ABP9NUJ4_9PSEU
MGGAGIVVVPRACSIVTGKPGVGAAADGSSMEGAAQPATTSNAATIPDALNLTSPPPHVECG